ncbi:MAG: transposase [Deltaproteobacteria bacterium]|nr:transposase [Deltaproteobacteria bacterium]
MARPLRIEYAGAHYHVTSRGNERKAIFRDDIDREKFLELIERAVEQFDIRVHAYVLMDNHYHLLLETPRGGLSRALRYLNGVYTQAFNRRHRRVGHLFQGRYKAILVEKDAYLLELSRYIHLNPWRVNRSVDPIKYRWSSLGSYVGARAAPAWLTVRDVMSQFGIKGKRAYREFVADGVKEGIRTPWDDVRGQAVIGSEEFVEEVMNKHGGERAKKTEVVRRKELVGVKPEALVAAVGTYYGIEPEELKRRGWRYTEPRYVASYLMRRYGFMGLREIGERVGLHFSAVGNAVQRVANNPTRTMVQALRQLEPKLKNQEA